MNENRRFAGKTALIFGGSRGIGAAIVRRFAAEGAAVAFTYVAARDRAAALVDAIEGTGGTAHAMQADSADGGAVEQAAAETVRRFGRLDIVVVNAGIIIINPLSEFSMADFDRMMAVNVRGVFVAIQASAPHLESGGRIVTIGSNTALRTAFPGGSVYSMTKGAVATLVRGIAIDLAPRAITVNNIQPGPTDTDMAAEHADAVIPLIPLRRLGQPEEIAAMVAYLASTEAAFVTGASLTIDGGYVA
jgi:3-oxoacyl-[acyl-carrier protein] reductase